MKHNFTTQHNRRAGFLLLLSLLFAQLAFAQVRVTGRVTDPLDGSGIIAATVKERGTANGTTTDIDGKFTLTVADSAATLTVDYVGFSQIVVPVNGRTQIDIAMQENETLLEQVVVVGYGTQKKSDLTGAVGSVKAKDIERIPAASVDQALQGKIAGVYVLPNSGKPGAGTTIRIRGTGTLNNANPLYVVDGMLLDDISFVNPQDVESIEVLKDASATAIYGNRGANGVIIITTKRGKSGEARISVSTYYGTQSVTRQIPMANAAQFGQLYNELTNSTYFADPAALGEGTNWQDEIFPDKAPIGNIQVSAMGGSVKLL